MYIWRSERHLLLYEKWILTVPLNTALEQDTGYSYLSPCLASPLQNEQKVDRVMTTAKLAGEQTPPPRWVPPGHLLWCRGSLELLMCAQEVWLFFISLENDLFVAPLQKSKDFNVYVYPVWLQKQRANMWMPYVDMSSNDTALIKETPFRVC